nr:MAG TPA: Rad52/22 family double-strand break repair protein [Caudoviricetes sp.]
MGDDLMENLRIYEQCRSVPETAKKEINGGRLNGKTDINPMWRIKILTEQFGPIGIGWYYKKISEKKEVVGEETAVFVDIELYIKADGEWSKPIFGTGGSMLASKEKSGIYVSDECYKMATTDAISVACKQLGIGADVYWESDASKYGQAQPQESTDPPEEETPEMRQRQELLEQLKAEMMRTGYGPKAVLKKYKVDAVDKLSILQIKDCTKKMKALPDAGKAVG